MYFFEIDNYLCTFVNVLKIIAEIHLQHIDARILFVVVDFIQNRTLNLFFSTNSKRNG